MVRRFRDRHFLFPGRPRRTRAHQTFALKKPMPSALQTASLSAKRVDRRVSTQLASFRTTAMCTCSPVAMSTERFGGMQRIDKTNPSPGNSLQTRELAQLGSFRTTGLPAVVYCTWLKTQPMWRRRSRTAHALMLLVLVGGLAGSSDAQQDTTVPGFLGSYCVSCHNGKLRTAGLALDTLDVTSPQRHADVWERVISKLRAGSMPPPGLPRPNAAAYRTVAASLEEQIDRAWTANPDPGRAGAVHRLNRAEYNNAIRDLFALDIDVKPLLPGDETADGSFDNFASSLSISTAHLERYLSVARQVTRLAVGLPPARPALERFEIPLHVLQDDRQSEDLPFGSRGGLAIRHNFPASGEYLIKVRLQRQYQDYLKGMGWPQQLDVRLDGKLLKRFTVGGGAKGRPAAASYAGDGEPGYAGDPEWEEYMQLKGDAGLELRTRIEAGPHFVGVSFVREMWEPEGLPQPLQRGRVIADDQVYMDYAKVGSVLVGGPYQAVSPAKDTPSRRAIFLCEPRAPAEERACATKILIKAGAVGLPATGDGRRRTDAAGVFRQRPHSRNIR